MPNPKNQVPESISTLDQGAIAPVLVTGASGNVGRAVVASLSALGVPFVAANTDPDRLRKTLGPNVTCVKLDLERPETYDEPLKGIRGLFLLRPPKIANVRSTLNVLVDHAIRAGVNHVTFLSVEGADRQPLVPHHAVERHLLSLDISSTILRPGFFAQNLGDAYRRDIAERRELYVPAGQGRVAFVDVRDVGEIAARSFVEPALRRAAFTLTGGKAVTFDEVAEILTKILGTPCRYRPASIFGYCGHLRRQDYPWMQIAVQTILHVGLRYGNAAKVDPTLQRLLGRPPRTMSEYIEDHRSLWLRDTSA